MSTKSGVKGGLQMPSSKEIGNKLVKLRGDKTQAEVAKALGINQTALSNYELGIRTPRDSIKAKIAKYYKVSVESIFF